MNKATESASSGAMSRASREVRSAWSHIGIGRTHARTHVIMIIRDLDIRIVNAATGELLRQLTLDPSRNYQPTGRPPGPTKATPRKRKLNRPGESGDPRTLTWVRGVVDVLRHRKWWGRWCPVSGHPGRVSQDIEDSPGSC
jgi:hypothetical protein